QMVIFLTYNDTAGKVFFSEDFGYSISNLAFGSHADNPVAFDCCTTSNRGNNFIGNANAAVICMELNGHNHPPLGSAPNALLNHFTTSSLNIKASLSCRIYLC